MKRVLVLCLSLVLALVGWSAVGADDAFYVIPVMKGNYAPVPKTGQTTSYATGDDGALRKGVAWPTPRFTDNGNGTITDNLTKLIWMKNANAFGTKTWAQALTIASNLQSGDAGLTDGSQPGDWRLPNRKELESLVDCQFWDPPLPNTLGTGKWAEGNPFQVVQSSSYWSSSTYADSTAYAWFAHFNDGYVNGYDKSINYYVWCVRAGP
jgi:hypothetical protein